MNSLQAKAGSLSDQLENLIDKEGLTNVLESISRILREKAEHIRINWDDDELARCYDKVAGSVDRAETMSSKHVDAFFS